jgi:hypothetical protein
MSQTPHDQLAKQYLEEFLAPFGVAQRQYEVPGEAKFVDLWFVPQLAAERPGQDLGLLGQMIQKPCLFEPYRNVPSRTDVRVAVMKLVWVQEDERRKARKAELSEEEQPCLWILAATASQPLLQDANAVTKPGWLPGVYFTADLFKTAIVVIDQLPETDETLWLRVLGRGDTQARSIREVLALPSSHPRRNQILRLVASWRVRMDLGELADFTSQEEPMALSEAFLTWEREKEIQTEMQTKEAIALNMLRKNLDLTTIAEVTGLTISQVEALQTSNS